MSNGEKRTAKIEIMETLNKGAMQPVPYVTQKQAPKYRDYHYHHDLTATALF